MCTPYFCCFPPPFFDPDFLIHQGGSANKESTCNVGDLGSIPGLGRSPGEEKGYPLQYSSLENFMDCIVHGISKSQSQLSNFQFHFLLTCATWEHVTVILWVSC